MRQGDITVAGLLNMSLRSVLLMKLSSDKQQNFTSGDYSSQVSDY